MEEKKYPYSYDGGDWECYPMMLETEYRQSYEEGLDIEKYKPLFDAVSAMENDEYKRRMADVIFDIVREAPMRADYPYVEPDDIETIRKERPDCDHKAVRYDPAVMEDKIRGAWYGRIAGCLLGKTVEGIRTDELNLLLKSTGNYPLYRYIRRSDITPELAKQITFELDAWWRCYADDKVDYTRPDDDTNYPVMAQKLVEDCGRDFTSRDVAHKWMECQPKYAYCTAERVAYCNFVKGHLPPDSGSYQNPYREWIGAQIRGDYFGYINPGDPETAADMAWRDARISHVKNGIYGEMMIAAMLASAAVEHDIYKIVEAGLSEIPKNSRLAEAVRGTVEGVKNGVSAEDFFAKLHKTYNEYSWHDWTLTVPNALIVVACLLYGNGDYGKSICMAVAQGFDTDCNGATVGSILGMRDGIATVGDEWRAPLHDTLGTDILQIGKISIEKLIATTMKHMK